MLSAESEHMKTAEFYQSTADAMGVLLYLYPHGSVTNFRKAGAEPPPRSSPTRVVDLPEIMALVTSQDGLPSSPSGLVTCPQTQSASPSTSHDSRNVTAVGGGTDYRGFL
jgi:hypothetical protein